MTTDSRVPTMIHTLVHAIGNREGGRVRVLTSMKGCEYVSCEHPDELLDVIAIFGIRWIKCDSGALLNLSHVIKIEEVEVEE